MALAAPPPNDDCAGAIAIPDGPFPVVTTPVVITDATPQGSDDPVLACSQTDSTIWYSFTPSITASYSFSTCLADGATGSTVYDTVLAVLDSTGGVCPSAASLGCNDSDACTSELPGAPYVDQATLKVLLTGGQTYFVVAGHWSGDVGGVSPGLEQIAIQVELTPAPLNDTCAFPAPLALDRVVQGTTVGAANDYRSPSACYTGIGQVSTTANGLDVVFSFVPPSNGKYSFRYVQDDTNAALRTQSPALYLANNCPAPAPFASIGGCIQGANRMNDQTTGNGNRSEEINCVSLTAGTPYYLFFDDRFTANAGGPLGVEVTRCVTETEPNGTPATANAYVPNSSCFMTGTNSPGGPAGDIDVFDLGAPPAGSTIFAALDAVASNTSDYELRITSASDTLGYDDDDGTSGIGSNAPVVAGPISSGSQVFARVNSKSVAAEPYHLYARVETGSPQPEVEGPNDTPQSSNLIAGGGFVSGVHSTATDQDCFRFVAEEGDNIAMFSNNNPSRAAGTIVDTWPVLIDLVGGPPTNTLFSGQTLRNIVTPSPGTLTGATPSITSEFWDYRARYTGTYFVCFHPIAPLAGPPLPYQGSISLNCGAIPAPASHVTDVAVTMAGPAGPVNTGAFADYTITLTNTGTDIAQDVRLVDVLPPQLVFVGLTKDDGFSGQNVGCSSLPAPGAAGGTVDCTNFSLLPGASTTVTVHVQVANCSAVAANVHNAVSITTASTDPGAANDTASADFTTSTDGICADLTCDGNACLPDLCTLNDHCEGSACVSTPVDCDDSNACTDDACTPATGACSHANDDSNTCSDGNACTTLDACLAGSCQGDGFDCSVYCPAGFFPVGGTCQKTYDIDDTLLDNLGGWCDGTGDNRIPGIGNSNLCLPGNYGFHWVDAGGGLTVASASVQLEAGVRTGTGSSTFAFNSVPGGSFINTFGNSMCAATHGPVTLPSLNSGVYVLDGLNSISITRDPTGFCEGLSRAANLGGNFARVTVRYLPPTQPTGVCKAGTCDPGSGACTYANLADDSPCGDGTVCNGIETCQNLPLATCTPGTPLDCDDGSVCTDDSCNALSGCVNAPIDCSDGNGCTYDTCGDPAGCQHTQTCDEGGTQSVPANGTASTDTEADGATPSDQIETAVTTPSGGQVTIQEGPATGPVPGGYDLVNIQSVITAPASTSTDPLVLTFRIDATALPTGYLLADLAIFRNGLAVGACADNSGDAVPDPCVSSRVVLGDGDVLVTVLTSQASTWKFGFPNCDDSNVCTSDSGTYPSCAHVNNTAACNDGNACTQTDACQSGACVGGNPVTCVASDQCHVAGVCNPGIGVCSNPAKPDGASCSDGSSCTQTDTCVSGACTGGNLSWSGVLQPINADGTSVFKLGSTIPVKFKLTGSCAGNPNLVANIYFYKLSNSEGPVNEATSTSAADTGTLFRYSAGDQYIFNLGTKGLSEGTWSLGIDLHDGVGIRVVTVGLRK